MAKHARRSRAMTREAGLDPDLDPDLNPKRRRGRWSGVGSAQLGVVEVMKVSYGRR
jgi:hypothetical protein